MVSEKVQNKSEYNKYQLYVTELDKVMILLLKLSGRLARAENAVNCLPEDAKPDQRVCFYLCEKFSVGLMVLRPPLYHCHWLKGHVECKSCPISDKYAACLRAI